MEQLTRSNLEVSLENKVYIEWNTELAATQSLWMAQAITLRRTRGHQIISETLKSTLFFCINSPPGSMHPYATSSANDRRFSTSLYRGKLKIEKFMNENYAVSLLFKDSENQTDSLN